MTYCYVGLLLLVILPKSSHGVDSCHGSTSATHNGAKSGLLVSVRLTTLGFPVFEILVVGFDILVMLIDYFDTLLSFALVGHYSAY